MFDYPSFAAVAAIAREGSFERAASVLGVTRSAVSQRVRGLEDRLGTILIVRAQPCRPTEAGRRLCAHVERVRLLEGELVDALPALAEREASAGRPTLRIAVNADSLDAWFMPALAAFAERSTALVDLVLDDEDHTADRLRSGDVLAAVTTDAAPVQGCRSVALGRLRYLAVASAGFASRWFTAGLTPATLAEAPVLQFDGRDDLQARWASALTGNRLAAPTHRIPATQGFLDAALAGLGWCLCPLSLAKPHLDAGRLVALSPDHPLDVPLHWQCARLGTALLRGLTREVIAAARVGLLPIEPGRPRR